LIERGYKKGIYHNHGTVNAEFIKVGGKAVSGAVAPTDRWSCPRSCPTAIRRRKFRSTSPSAMRRPSAPARATPLPATRTTLSPGRRRGAGGAEEGQARQRPSFREALRASLENVRNVVGTHGVYNMNAETHNGLDGACESASACRQRCLAPDEVTPDIVLWLAQDGITNGAIYALLALALLLVFSVTRIIFVPQGEFISYAALSLALLQAGQVPGVVYVLVGGGVLAAVFDIGTALRDKALRRLPWILLGTSRCLAPWRRSRGGRRRGSSISSGRC